MPSEWRRDEDDILERRRDGRVVRWSPPEPEYGEFTLEGTNETIVFLNPYWKKLSARRWSEPMTREELTRKRE